MNDFNSKYFESKTVVEKKDELAFGDWSVIVGVVIIFLGIMAVLINSLLFCN